MPILCDVHGASLGANTRMREVEKILAAFPGPVMLYTSRLRKLLGLAVFFGLTVFCIWTIVTGSTQMLHGVYYDSVMGYVSAAAFAGLTIRSLILLRVPSAASLTLDADGFAINRIFRTHRTPWREVSDFRVQKASTGFALLTYDLGPADAEPKQRRMLTGARAIADTYGQSKRDLAWLMEEWRKRALAPQHEGRLAQS